MAPNPLYFLSSRINLTAAPCIFPVSIEVHRREVGRGEFCDSPLSLALLIDYREILRFKCLIVAAIFGLDFPVAD